MIFINRLLIAILLCALLCGCREKKDIGVSMPAISADSVISPGKMILILADVHIVEAAMQVEPNERIDPKDKSAACYKGIFQKYHISPARFDQNLTFYCQNPENYAKMYEKVVTVLENRQKSLTGAK